MKKNRITRGIADFLLDSASYPKIVGGIDDFLLDSANYRA